MNSEPRDKEFRPMASDIKGQKLDYPAKQSDMNPAPDSDLSNYSAANKLQGKVAIITGGDSGIGRAIAIAFGMEGANVAILYNVNDSDAEETKRMVEAKGRKCLLIKMDVRSREACFDAVDQTLNEFGKLNILINKQLFKRQVTG